LTILCHSFNVEEYSKEKEVGASNPQHYLEYNAETKNVWIYTSTSKYKFLAPFLTGLNDATA
jgi:hypothetical protein